MNPTYEDLAKEIMELLGKVLTKNIPSKTEAIKIISDLIEGEVENAVENAREDFRDDLGAEKEAMMEGRD